MEKTLIVSKISNLITKIESRGRKDSKTPIKRVYVERRYSYYSKIRYNSRTYKVEIKNINNSNASK